MKPIVLFFIGLVAVFFSSFSMGKFAYRFNHFTMEGISGREIVGIVPDNKGFIWIGTPSGLICCDGYDQTAVCNIPTQNGSFNDRVFCLEKDGCNHLWIGRQFNETAILSLSTRRFMKVGYLPGKIHPIVATTLKSFGQNEIWAGTPDGKVFAIRICSENEQNDSVMLSVKEILSLTSASTGMGKVTCINRFGQNTFVGYEQGLIGFQVGNPPRKILKQTSVNCVFADSRQNIWIGTSDGLRIVQYQPKQRDFKSVHLPYPDLLNRCCIYSLVEDTQQNIFIGTEQNGLFVYQPSNSTCNRYDKSNDPSFPSRLKSLCIDRSNKLWLATQNNGITVADLSQKKFYSLKYHNKPLSENEPTIQKLLEDRLKRLWIATVEDGLYAYDHCSGKSYRFSPGESHKFLQSKINRMCEDRKGNVWFCTTSGLYYFPARQLLTEKPGFRQIIDNFIAFSSIGSIVEDEYGRYWIAANGDLYQAKLDLKKNTVVSKTRFPKGNTKHKLPESTIYYLSPARQNVLWAGTLGGGMCRIAYNNQNDSLTVDKYTSSHSGETYISNNITWWILDRSDSIWVGTDNGLNLYVRNLQNFFVHCKTYHISDGLPSNEIAGILDDAQGNLWLDTGNGLSKLLTNRRTFINFDYPPGGQNNSLTRGTNRTPLETMYVGSTNGLYGFYPKEITENSTAPKTVLTRLLIHNKEVNPGEAINGQVLLEKQLPYTQSIRLSYKNNHFTLRFSALNFAPPKSNRYTYRLDGYDNKWLETYNHEHTVTYSNLPPGKYTFKVKAINCDGISDKKPASLAIAITAPPWKSTWAYILYFAAFVAGLTTIISYYRNKIRLENEILLEKRKRDQERELNEMKNDFYTIISHELRTPLTLLTAPLSEIERGVTDSNRLNELHRLLSSSTEKLMRLVNQLLDFSKTGENLRPLHVTRINVTAFLKNLAHSFAPLAMQKKLSIVFSTTVEAYNGPMDTDVMDKIVSNIVHNAIKYTSDGGNVQMDFSIEDQENQPFYRIRIADSGIGIASSEINKIFEKYYQHRKGQGYGIGLSVVKNLVALHQGSIEVTSTPGRGTAFLLKFPAFESAYADNMFLSETSTHKENTKTVEEPISNTLPQKNEKKRREVVLIVEDNVELRTYLERSLSADYSILGASNGEEGLQKTLESIPDLIVSDIAMPEMDGMALLSAVKSDTRTNHIPFIFLTAAGGVQNQLKGLTTGAEDYIEKPFDMLVLQKKIQNLLKLVEMLREKQRRLFLFEPETMERTTPDHIFLEKASQIIQKHLTDPHFSPEALAEKMAVSRRQLYRILARANTSPVELIHSVKQKQAKKGEPTQIKFLRNNDFIRAAAQKVHDNITNSSFDATAFANEMGMNAVQLRRKLQGTINLSVTEFIRSIRMKRAAELLKTGRYRISEVMLMVGFDNPSYFTKTFKQQFGQTPKDYQDTALLLQTKTGIRKPGIHEA